MKPESIEGRRIEPIHIYGELAFQKALDSGKFHTLADSFPDGFSAYWWREIFKFETYLLQYFSKSEFFISDHVQLGKMFILEIYDNRCIQNIIEHSAAFLKANQPDASICVTQFFKAPLPSSSFIFGLRDRALDQDDVAWFIKNAVVAPFFMQDISDLEIRQGLRKGLTPNFFSPTYTLGSSLLYFGI